MRAHGIVPESRTAPEDGKRRSRPRDEGKHADDGAGAPKNFDKAGVDLERSIPREKMEGNTDALPRPPVRRVLPSRSRRAHPPSKVRRGVPTMEEEVGTAAGNPDPSGEAGK